MYIFIQWLNSFFHVAQVVRVPSPTGTGSRFKLEFDGFYPMLSAIFCTADVMDDIEFCSFWYAANFKVIWRKWALVLSPFFFVANTSLSSGPVPSSTSLCSIISCCFLTSLNLVSTKLNAASSVFSSGFTEKIVSDSSINSYKRLTVLSSFPTRVFTSLWAEFKCETWRLLGTRRNLLQQVSTVSPSFFANKFRLFSKKVIKHINLGWSAGKYYTHNFCSICD